MNRATNPVILALALVAAVLGGLFASLDRAHAQARPGDEVITTCSQSITTTAPVVSAVTGKRLCVRSMVISTGNAGIVVFTDGSGGTTLANVYLPADTPTVIDDRVLGTQGITTTAGNALHAVLSGATLTGVFRVVRD